MKAPEDTLLKNQWRIKGILPIDSIESKGNKQIDERFAFAWLNALGTNTKIEFKNDSVVFTPKDSSSMRALKDQTSNNRRNEIYIKKQDYSIDERGQLNMLKESFKIKEKAPDKMYLIDKENNIKIVLEKF